MKCIFVFVCLLPLAVFSQTIRIKEIKLRPNPKYYNTADSTINYPIISTGSQSVSQLINELIKEQVLYPEDNRMTAQEALSRMAEMGLADLAYEITYSKNGILSLRIDIEVEAAYPNHLQKFFNFDTRSGQSLKLKDIVSEKMFEQFKSKVFADKIDSLKSYKESQLQNKELDTLTYQQAIERVDSDCIAIINMDNFSISPTGIEIIDKCTFPHVMRSMEPTYALKYSCQFMHPYLRSEFQWRLSNSWY